VLGNKNKKGLMWDTVGKAILILTALVIIMLILARLFGQSQGIADTIKGFLGR